jgi:TatA/E family protein of Tat protein translocase
MAGLTPAHLLIIMVIALVVIGPGKLPEVGAALGKSIREFQKASSGVLDPVQQAKSTLTNPLQPSAQAPVAQAPAAQPPAQSFYAGPYAQPGYPAPYPPAPGYEAAPGYAPQTGYTPGYAQGYAPAPQPGYGPAPQPGYGPQPGYVPPSPMYAPASARPDNPTPVDSERPGNQG